MKNNIRFFAGPNEDPRKFFRMEKKKPKEADIYLYDIIGDSWDGTTARQFAQDLKTLEDIEVLNVFINSPGGSVFDGVAIYNTLIRHRARKNVYIDGVAASIASIVAMAGDEIVIAKNGMMMIHNAWAFAMGNATDLRAAADKLDKITEVMKETYADRSGSEAKEIEKWMNAETWFNAEEALDAGLVDSISQKEVEIAAMSKHNLTQFRNVPKLLLDKSGSAGLNQNNIPTANQHPALAKAAVHLARQQRNAR